MVVILFVTCFGPTVAGAVNEVAEQVEKELLEQEDAPKSPLSVAPLDHIEYPASRPAWLAQSPKLEGAVHEWIVVTQPAETPEQCDAELVRLQLAAVISYAEMQSDFQSSTRDLPITSEWIEENLVRGLYEGEVKQGGTVLYERASKLMFDKQGQSTIMKAWKKVQVRDRLGATGVLLFGGMLCLFLGSMVTNFLSRRAVKLR